MSLQIEDDSVWNLYAKYEETIESMRQQLAAANAEIERMKDVSRKACVGLDGYFSQQLAEKDAEIERLKGECQSLAIEATPGIQLSASQLREQQLRDEKDELSMLLKAQRSEWHKAYEIAMLAQHRASALTTALNRVLESVIPYREDGEPSIPDSVIAVVNSALALPTDTSALEAMIAKAGEVMRERCAVECEQRQMAYATAGYERHAQATAGLSDDIRALPGVTLEDIK